MLTTAAIGANANATGADRATFKITDAKLYVPLLLYQQNTMRKYQNYKAKGLKDQFIEINIR